MLKFYHWFFANYVWLLATLFGLTFVMPVAGGALSAPVAIVSLLGAHIALFFFVQKQRLADQRLAVKLLLRFDDRWTQLQPGLQAIHGADAAQEPTDNQIEQLRAFFDLCAELYLHYSQGHIPPLAWQTWLNRMRIYYYHPRIRKAWDAELKHDSHYGFGGHLLK